MIRILEPIIITSVLSLIWVLGAYHIYGMDGGTCVILYVIVNLVNIAALIRKLNE